MSVCLMLKLLNELNKGKLCEPLGSIILFHSKSSTNLVMNLHEFNILFLFYSILFYSIYLYPNKELLILKKRIIFHRHAYNVTLMFSALQTLCLYNSVNDVLSKCYYTSVMSLLVNGYITHSCSVFYVIKYIIDCRITTVQ